MSAQQNTTLPHFICGSEGYEAHLEKQFPGYAEAIKNNFDIAEKNVKALAQNVEMRGGRAVIQVPVVFHVVYNKDAENLSDAVLNDQIKILNDAYRNRHADVSKTRDLFKNLAADAEVEFFLAKKDPQNQPTTGIDRKKTTVSSFGSLFELLLGNFTALDKVKQATKGGTDAWDTQRYLNIWVCNMADPLIGPSILGFATPPVNPLPSNWPADFKDATFIDGVVLHYQVVGSNNPTYDPSVASLATAGRGRAAVHEVGHYLGLRHIWGETGDIMGKGSCDNDDGIEDTPRMASNSQPTSKTDVDCPIAKNTCGEGMAGDLPDMFENYMDYSNQTCQTMFSKGQVAHMRSILTLQRLLLWSQVATPTNEIADAPALQIYPNPTHDAAKINIANFSTDKLLNVNIFNQVGQLMLSRDIANTSNIILDVDVSDLSSGMYFITVKGKNTKQVGKLVIQ